MLTGNSSVVASCWLFIATAALCIHSSTGLTVARGRACLPGENPEAGSPPCVKTYYGSGNIYATPAPGSFALPTPDPAGFAVQSGSLAPGCICRMDLGKAPHIGGALSPPPMYNVQMLGNGELEVLTVDVKLANRVRCDNVTLAADVAKLLHIPLKRITVTPWSWTLPDPPQSNYLAFVQEDHERCECDAKYGTQQGFRTQQVKTASEGQLLAPDTSVMTVSQFNAMQGATVGPECADGLALMPILPAECPKDATGKVLVAKTCDEVDGGELCLGDGKCGTNFALRNCLTTTVYKKACAIPPSIDDPLYIATGPQSPMDLPECGVPEAKMSGAVGCAIGWNLPVDGMKEHQVANPMDSPLTLEGLPDYFLGGTYIGHHGGNAAIMPQCTLAPQWNISFNPPIRLFLFAVEDPCPEDYSAGLHRILDMQGWRSEKTPQFHRSDGKYMKVWSKTFMNETDVSVDGLRGTMIAGAVSQKVYEYVMLKNKHLMKYYVSTAPNGQLYANKDAPERYLMKRNDDNTISLRPARGRFITALMDGSLFANKKEIGPWQKFVKIDHDDGTSSLETAHGKFLGAAPNGLLTATADAIGSWETFVVEVYRPHCPPPGSSPAPAPAPATEVPPASRVQMLTRDPCLVQLLRDMTPVFRTKLAFLLGVPEESVIVDPPPVAGTIGLIQTGSNHTSKKKKASQTPVLGVRQCNLAELGELAQKVSLISSAASTREHVQAQSPAPASLVQAQAPAPAFAVPPLFTVDHNPWANFYGSGPSPGPGPAPAAQAFPYKGQRVSLVLKLHGIDYDMLAKSWPVVGEFVDLTKMAIAVSGHVEPAPGVIKVALYPGSVVIEAKIYPPPPTAAAAVAVFLNETVCPALLTRLSSMIRLQDTMTGGPLECEQLELKLEDPPWEAEESNRAWIALWGVSVLSPFAQNGAFKLLQLINDPKSNVSKLLPMTLGRIPGLKYRGLQEPNKAIKFAKETRLPPPEDKAVQFALPDPLNKEAMLEEQKRRMAMEEKAAGARDQVKAAQEELDTMNVIKEAERTAFYIQASKAKFTNAARVHTEALRAANATRGPDIVPYDVLEVAGDTESPYPWQDQYPSVPLALVQGKQKATQKLRALRALHLG